MSEKKDDLMRIDEVEIQPLSDEDLETASGGDTNTCPSDGCPTTFTCSCGCKGTELA